MDELDLGVGLMPQYDEDSFVFDENDPDFDDLPELLPHDEEEDDDDDEDDDDFDDLPELEVIPELVLATYGAIRDRVDIALLRSTLEAAPADETMGRPLLRLIKFAMRCNRERLLQHGILRLLIERDPECPKITDERGGFLLHTACECAAPIDVVQYLIEVHPDGARVPSEDGQLPLHYACARRNACVETIDVLLERFPGAVRCASLNKMLPLHVALNKCGSVSTVLKLLEFYPESAAITAAGDELPLHIACRTNMSLEIVEKLVKLHPEGIHAKDGEGGLALHRACSGFNSTLGAMHPLYEPILLVHLLIACDCEECGAPLEVAMFLMEKDPDGASTMDSFGRIPLHYASRNGALELATKLMERFPAGIMVQDAEGKLPIHLACANGSNEALTRLLIDHHPEGLKVADKSKSIPLHYAASRRMAKTETLRLLLERHPGGIHAADENGRLPLHHACETHCLDRIRLLVEVDPLTVIETARTDNSPLKLACLSHRHAEIKSYLLEKQTAAVQEIREAFDFAIGDQCGFPDLVQAVMWEFAKPELFQPSEEELEDDLDDDSGNEEDDSDEESDYDESDNEESMFGDDDETVEDTE